MSEAKDKNLGVYHVHRFHMLNKSGHILCGMVSNKKLEVTKDAERVNCKLCIKKIAKAINADQMKEYKG